LKFIRLFPAEFTFWYLSQLECWGMYYKTVYGRNLHIYVIS
jgi:hypothetical protein